MNKNTRNLIFGISGGLLAGVLLTIFTLYSIAPSMMLKENRVSLSFDETIEKFEKSVKDHNWKIPHIHDLKKTMDKFGKNVRNVKVYELCHPDHAGKILEKSDERIVSSLMPCRVAIYEKDDGNVYVSRMNSGMMAGMIGGLVAEVMETASNENEDILEAILN